MIDDVKHMVAYKDASGVTRAWATSRVKRQARKIAEEQLAAYKAGDSYNPAMEPFTLEITEVEL